MKGHARQITSAPQWWPYLLQWSSLHFFCNMKRPLPGWLVGSLLHDGGLGGTGRRPACPDQSLADKLRGQRFNHPSYKNILSALPALKCLGLALFRSLKDVPYFILKVSAARDLIFFELIYRNHNHGHEKGHNRTKTTL